MKSWKNRWKLTAAVLAVLLTTGLGCSSEDQVAEADDISAPQPGEPNASGEPDDNPGFLERLAPKKAVTIPIGTPIKVRTTSTMSTKTSTSGESFVATVAEPVVVDGRTLFEEGDRAIGVVAFADKGGRVKGVARIGAKLTEIGGHPVDTGSYVVVAKKTHTKDATKIGIGAGVGAAIGAIAGGGSGAAKGAGVGAGAGTGAVLATRGEPAVIPAESLLTFELEAPLTVE